MAGFSDEMADNYKDPWDRILELTAFGKTVEVFRVDGEERLILRVWSKKRKTMATSKDEPADDFAWERILELTAFGKVVEIIRKAGEGRLFLCVYSKRRIE